MKILTGKSILDQVAYGPLRVYRRQPFQLEVLSQLSTETEVNRFQTAQHRAVLQLADLYDQAAVMVGPQAASIFAIHAMLLEDTSFVDSILSIIRTQYTTAEYAVQVAGTSYSAAFAAMDNPYMAARGADLRDISNRLIRLLLGQRAPDLLGKLPCYFGCRRAAAQRNADPGPEKASGSGHLARQCGQPHRDASSPFEHTRIGTGQHNPGMGRAFRYFRRFSSKFICRSRSAAGN